MILRLESILKLFFSLVMVLVFTYTDIAKMFFFKFAGMTLESVSYGNSIILLV